MIIRRRWEQKREEVQETNRRDSGGKHDRGSSMRTVVYKKLPTNPWIPHLFVIKNDSSPQNSKIIIAFGIQNSLSILLQEMTLTVKRLFTVCVCIYHKR